MKKYLTVLFLLVAMPVMAEEANGLLYNADSANAPSTGSINMTPKNTFSGYSKSNDVRSSYPNLSNRVQYNTTSAYQRQQMMKAKSVKEISNTSNLSREDENSGITFNQFPKQYTTDDMLHLNAIQNGVQNMYMNF